MKVADQRTRRSICYSCHTCLSDQHMYSCCATHIQLATETQHSIVTTNTDNKTHATTQRGHAITKSLVQQRKHSQQVSFALQMLHRSYLCHLMKTMLYFSYNAVDENNIALLLQYHVMKTILHLSYNIPWWKQYHIVLTMPLDENNTALVLQRHLMETLLHCSHDALEW